MPFGRQQACDAGDEFCAYLAVWTGSPLYLAESIRHQRIRLVDSVDDHGQDKGSLRRYEVRAIHRQLPLESKVILGACARVRGGYGDE